MNFFAMRLYTTLLLCSFFAHTVLAAPLSVNALLGQLQKHYGTTSSFSANFTQHYTHKILGRTEESTGTVRYKKPGFMRWDYKAPRSKSFVIDGKSLWLYQPDDKQAFVDKCFKQDGLSASIAFLWGQGKLNQEFKVTRYAGTIGSQSDDRLLLVPKKDNTAFKEIVLVLDAKTHKVKESAIIDTQYNINRFSFHDVKYNPALPKTVFNFAPPKDVTVSRLPGTCLK